MKQKLLVLLVILLCILPSEIVAKKMSLQQMEDKTLVSEDWDRTSATETWYNDLVVWEIDWVQTYSDGTTVRKTFQNSDGRSLKVLSDWMIKDGYTTTMKFETTAPTVSETVTSWLDQIRTVEGAKFEWRRDIREFSTEVTYTPEEGYTSEIGETKTRNRYKAIDPSNCSVTYKGKVYSFVHHQSVSAVNASGTSSYSSLEIHKGTNYSIAPYTEKLSYTVGDNTKDVYAFGTGIKLRDGCFFPVEWGEIKEVFQTKVLNETGKGYVYVWSLHFSRGYILPVVVRSGASNPEFHFEYVLKTDNNSYNSAVYNPRTNRWDNAIVGTESFTDRYSFEIENGSLRAKDSNIGLMGTWSSLPDEDFPGFDMTIYCGIGGSVEYNGNEVSYESSTWRTGKTFSVNSSQPVPVNIYIKPETGYRLKGVTRGLEDLSYSYLTNTYRISDGVDASGYLDGDKLSFQNVCSNIRLYFQFEKIPMTSETTFNYQYKGVWYHVNFQERTASVLIANNKDITEADIQNLTLSGSTILEWMELPKDQLTKVGEEILRPTATYYFAVNTINKNSFYNCTKLTSLNIPNTVTTIEASAFQGCTSLTAINIPNSVTSIGDSAFQNCEALANVTIGSSVNTISKRVFNNCKGLKSIEIPHSVTCIDDYAFDGCESLNTLTLGESVETIGQWAFYNCMNLTAVNIPNKVKKIGDNAFNGCVGLNTLTLGESVETIGNGAFNKCRNLTTVNIANKTKVIGDNAFSDCESLISLTLGEAVETIGQNAFYNCINLTDVNIPNKTRVIGDNAFAGCESIKTLTLGDAVETIGQDAFNYCISIQSVVIPNSVINIDTRAFAACYNLSSVLISKESHLATIGADAFLECNSLKEITLPATLKSIGDGAFFLDSYMKVHSFIESPFAIDAFGYDEANILFVPDGTKNKYTSTQGWGDAFESIIEEGSTNDGVTLTAKSYTREYGEANPTFEYTISDGTIISGTPTVTCSATATSPVGTYDIVISKGTVSNSGTVNLVKGTLTITKAPLTISAGNYTKKEGEDNPEFAPVFTGFKNNETKAVLTKQPVVTTTATKASKAGNYTVSVSGAEAQNYSISYQTGTLTVTTSSTPVTNAEAYAVLVDDGKTVTFYYDDKKTSRGGIDINNRWIGRSNSSPYGTATKVVFDESFAKYRPESTSYWFHKCSMITTIIGLENLCTDDVTDMGGMFAGCSSLTSINLSNFKTDKVKYMYDMFSGCSSLTSLDLSGFNASNVTNMGSMFYGCTNLKSLNVCNFNTANVTTMRAMFYQLYSLSSLDLSSFKTDKVEDMSFMFYGSIGIKTIYVGSEWNTTTVKEDTEMFANCDRLVGGQGTAYHYSHQDKSYAHIDEGTANPGYFTDINDKNKIVTLTAMSYTREYGKANPMFEWIVSDGTVMSGTPTITCSATAKSPVGTYDIIISKGTVSNKGTVNLVKGTLTITKAPLTISAGNYTKEEGEDNPVFTPTFSGFMNNETKSVLTKQPTITTTATKDSPAGDYDVIVSGAEAQNYSITYENGTLNVTEKEVPKVDVTLTAMSYTREYGQANPMFEWTVSDGTVTSGTPTITCSATATSPVGTYDIVISKGTVGNNGTVTLVNGTLTITKAPLTITTGNYTKEEGEDNPEFTPVFTGFKNNETETVLTKQPVITTTATKDSPAGEYEITASGAEAQNYSFSYQPGTLTVTAKPAELEPIEGETSMNTDELRGQDLSDNVVGNIYYVVGENGYDASDQSIVISQPTNMSQIADKEPGSKDVKENFNGMIMKVAKGKGLITVNVKTSGNAQLVVQVGNGVPMLATKTEKGDVVFRYDVTEDTYVYIYAILGSSTARTLRAAPAAPADAVRIYSITVSPGTTDIKAVTDGSCKEDAIIYDLQGRRVENPGKGLYIIGGRKISVK